MAKAKKSNVGTIYKLGGFLAFIMLGYLGIRCYKDSIERLKINNCIELASELVRNVQQAYNSEYNYEGLDYARAVRLNIIPQGLFREGYKEAINPFEGGVDIYHTDLHAENDNMAFAVSFQGLSSYACQQLLQMPWDEGQNITMIVTGGFPMAKSSDALDNIYTTTKQEDIKNFNIFKSEYVYQVGNDVLKRACGCSDNTCSVVWKFR